MNELFWLYQGLEDALQGFEKLSTDFDRLSKIFPLLNMTNFKIWHSCISKDYTVFLIFLHMPQLPSIMSGYAWICLNIHQYAWTWLNIDESAWICMKMSEWSVLTIPWFWICLIIVDTWQDFEYASGVKNTTVLNMLR